MKLLNNLPVRGKLAFAFGCVLVLMLFLGGFSARQMTHISAQTDAILNGSIPGIREGLNMSGEHVYYRQREIRLMITDPKDASRLFDKMAISLTKFEAARKKYEAAIGGDAERKLYEDAMALSKAYYANTVKVIAAYNGGDIESAKANVMSQASLKLFDDAHAAFEKLSEYNDSEADHAGLLAASIYRNSLIGITVAVVAAVLAAVVLGLTISRSIAEPLRGAVVVAEAVALGNLTHSPTNDSKDELGQLTRALGNMVTKLRDVVTEVRGGVDSVGTAAAQIAAGNIDLSQRTEEQASNLEQTAASMEQLTATVKQNSENARAAAQIAAGATEAAARGGRVVGEVVSTMQAISESSKRIADIIGTIDGIAFQTNILALNAAVEAARAGEQGRGFAVVASEVRSLAQRSAGAAKQIKSLIQQSVSRVDDGGSQVAEAGKAMTDIVTQVKRVHDLVSEISAASIEQSQGIAQVGAAVAQLDQVTQQNAALVEESAAAAESMSAQAIKLAASVSHFDVGTGAATAAARPSAAVRFKPKPAPKNRALASTPLASRRIGASSAPARATVAAVIVATAAVANVKETAGADEWAAF